MKAGKYSVKEFFINRYVDQIVIPEIQRDYVWKEEQVKGVFDSIINDYRKFENGINDVPKVETTDENLIKAFEEFYQKRYYSSNIGFIYAYSDEQNAGNYYLIDGQQRITTIYLLLLSLASIDDNLKQEFKNTYCFDRKLKIDYKVRESAHQFLKSFVNSILEGKLDIENESWYYKNKYDSDTTIQSILNNSTILKELLLGQNNLDVKSFYHFLENYVDFWYFDTNVSEQGEELYIYMNARGEQIQGNENIKADLLGQLSSKSKGENLVKLKNSYGELWESWQDYFWNKRNRNENADRGFNEFLACISGLKENLLFRNDKFYSKDKFEKNGKVYTQDLLTALDLNHVESYVNVLQFLDDNKESFKSLYNYSNWVEDCITEIWNLLNDNTTNWFADYNDANRATERNRMVFLWSIFYYTSEVLTKDKNSKDPNIISNVFRFMRMFYLRYKNNNRSVSTLVKTIDLIHSNGIFDSSDNCVNEDLPDIEDLNIEESADFNSLTKEEVLRSKFLQNYLEDLLTQRKFEEAIWQIEDHKFNLDGSDVGATNFSHFIDLDSELDLDKIQKIVKKYYEMFPADKKSYKKVQSLLLYYGAYWRRVSPWYYRNYKFDDWRRIIRNICIDSENGRNPFRDLFYDFLLFNGSLKEFLNNKRQIVIEHGNVNKFQEKLIWYNQHLKEKMWSNGNHLVLSNGEYCSLPDWESKDKNFSDDFIIYSIDKNLKGGEKRELGLYIKSETSAIV